LENAVLQTATCSHEKDAIKLHSQAPDFHQNMYAYYYWIFPNLMLNFYAWGLSVNIIEPISKNKTRVKYMGFTFPHVNIPPADGADVGTVELEDQAVVQAVQQGINSRYYSTGRYSATFETGVHHFHKMLAFFTKS
jgi:choline monooxygenase